MKKEELYRFVDHTALKAVTTWKEIQQLCQEARFFRMASVCIPSSYVKRAHEYFPELNICTVVGFPLGNASTEAKLAETRQALEDGANEIDMVINLGMVKNQEYSQVTEEIRLLKEATGGATLEDVILMKQHVGPNVKIKAAGGIRSKEDMELYIGAGCSRIGTSSAIAMLQDGE